jgi:hypothetical protein
LQEGLRRTYVWIKSEIEREKAKGTAQLAHYAGSVLLKKEGVADDAVTEKRAEEKGHSK